MSFENISENESAFEKRAFLMHGNYARDTLYNIYVYPFFKRGKRGIKEKVFGKNKKS